jgi:hypothetical protein
MQEKVKRLSATFSGAPLPGMLHVWYHTVVSAYHLWFNGNDFKQWQTCKNNCHTGGLKAVINYNESILHHTPYAVLNFMQP